MCFQSIDQQINCKGDCLNDRQRTHGDETALTFGEGEDAIVFGTYGKCTILLSPPAP